MKVATSSSTENFTLCYTASRNLNGKSMRSRTLPPEFLLEDLSRRALGERHDELDGLGHLVGRDPIPAEGDQDVGVRLRPLAKHHERLHRLAADGIRRPPDGGSSD